MFDSLVMIGYGTWSFLLCFVWLPFIAFFGFNFCCLYQIIVFQFGLGANAHYVILELYAQGNIILTDSEYMIMTLLRSHRFVFVTLLLSDRLFLLCLNCSKCFCSCGFLY